jgi:hypothetical protein
LASSFVTFRCTCSSTWSTQLVADDVIDAPDVLAVGADDFEVFAD